MWGLLLGSLQHKGSNCIFHMPLQTMLPWVDFCLLFCLFVASTACHENPD